MSADIRTVDDTGIRRLCECHVQRPESRIMVNSPGGVTMLGYAYRCPFYLSFLHPESPAAEMQIEFNNNK